MSPKEAAGDFSVRNLEEAFREYQEDMPVVEDPTTNRIIRDVCEQSFYAGSLTVLELLSTGLRPDELLKGRAERHGRAH